MLPARRADVPVRVKNSYNPSAPGTLITGECSHGNLVSAITSKSNVAIVDIVSTRMLGAYGFLSKACAISANVSADISRLCPRVTLHFG